MVKIALAGATSQFAKEITDGLVAEGKHQILGLARKIPSELQEAWPQVTYVASTYEDRQELVKLLQGVDVVLCFFAPLHDAEGAAEIRLIDAAVEAGVKRYIPSDWFIASPLSKVSGIISWMSSKLIVRKHLEDLNRDKKVLEYSIVAPGMLMDYLAFPHATLTKHTAMIEAFVNVQDMRGFYMEGHENDRFTVTAIHDMVKVVLRIIDYEGEWPVDGGISGETVSFAELVELGQKLRGKRFDIDILDPKDVEAGVVKITKLAPTSHPSAPPEQVEAFAKAAFGSILRAIATGHMVVDGEWNRLLPDYKFMTVEELLSRHF